MKSVIFFQMFIFLFAPLSLVHAMEEKGKHDKQSLKNQLKLACLQGNELVVQEILLNPGIDVNAINDLCLTPLAAVAMLCNPTIMSLLLKYGASINGIEARYSAPLHYFISTNGASGVHFVMSHVMEERKSCFKIFLEYKANLNAQDYEGNSPLHLAGRLYIKKLINAGADMRIKNDAEETPLYYRLKRQDNFTFVSVFALLEQGAPINEYYKNGMPFLSGYRISIEQKSGPLNPEGILKIGEMSKIYDHVDSLVILSLKALGKDIHKNPTLQGILGTCLDMYAKFSAEHKTVARSIKDMQHFCPKTGRTKDEIAFIIGSFADGIFVDGLVSRFITYEKQHKIEERLQCYWGKEWDSFDDTKKQQMRQKVLCEREIYLQKRMLKEFHLKPLYDQFKNAFVKQFYGKTKDLSL